MDDRSSAIAGVEDSRGRVVVAGKTQSACDFGRCTDGDLFVARYKENGKADANFGGGDGVKTIAVGADFVLTGLAVGADDDVVVALNAAPAGAEAPGNSFLIYRLTAKGKPDPAFGAEGTVAIDNGLFIGGGPNGLALAADGSILAAGAAPDPGGRKTALARLRRDGSLDPGFGQGGIATLRIDPAAENETGQALDLTGDGRVVVAGGSSTQTIGPGGGAALTVGRFLANGTPDSSFGSGGGTTIASSGTGPNFGRSNDVEIQADGSVLVGGGRLTGTRNCFSAVLARLTANGEPDSAFGTGGVVYTGSPNECGSVSALATSSGGGILATWPSSLGALVARYTASGQSADGVAEGQPYFSISVSGQVTYSHGLNLDSKGRLVLTGEVESERCWSAAKISTYSPCVAAIALRLTPAGTLDRSFGERGIVSAPNVRICPRPDSSCPGFPDARRFRALVRRTLLEGVTMEGNRVHARFRCARGTREPCRIKAAVAATHGGKTGRLVLKPGRARALNLPLPSRQSRSLKLEATVSTEHQRRVTVSKRIE